MQIASRFTIAVHILLAIDRFGGEYKTTSEFLASSVNVNPVIIRRTLASLKAAGLIEVKAGSGGAKLTSNFEDVSLYDVYRAVDACDKSLFHLHEKPNPSCPVGKNIRRVLTRPLNEAQAAMENELKKVTLAELKKDLNA